MKLFTCKYCGKEFSLETSAERCYYSHNIIYVPISKNDLGRLLNFIYSMDTSFLSETLVSNLSRYLKGN